MLLSAQRSTADLVSPRGKESKSLSEQSLCQAAEGKSLRKTTGVPAGSSEDEEPVPCNVSFCPLHSPTATLNHAESSCADSSATSTPGVHTSVHFDDSLALALFAVEETRGPIDNEMHSKYASLGIGIHPGEYRDLFGHDCNGRMRFAHRFSGLATGCSSLLHLSGAFLSVSIPEL